MDNFEKYYAVTAQDKIAIKLIAAADVKYHTICLAACWGITALMIGALFAGHLIFGFQPAQHNLFSTFYLLSAFCLALGGCYFLKRLWTALQFGKQKRKYVLHAQPFINANSDNVAGFIYQDNLTFLSLPTHVAQLAYIHDYIDAAHKDDWLKIEATSQNGIIFAIGPGDCPITDRLADF